MVEGGPIDVSGDDLLPRAAELAAVGALRPFDPNDSENHSQNPGGSSTRWNEVPGLKRVVDVPQALLA